MDLPIPNKLRFPADRQHREPRCIGCGYVLLGLDHPSCPECGRGFDPDEAKTYLRRRPFVWHQYWWPGIVLTVGLGFVWAASFYSHNALGWGLFIGVPFMVGTLMGFRPLPTWGGALWMSKGFAILAALILVGLLMLGGFAGLFCSVILLMLFVPIVLGGYFGGMVCARLLAWALKHTHFSQREYLPGLLVFVLLPGVAHLAELGFAPPIERETVSTSRVLAMDSATAWEAQLFYEEVPGPRPVLHTIGLPTPEQIEGEITAVGDRQVCHYSGGGTIVREATVYEPGRRLAFKIVEQRGFEDRSLRFIEGEFTFSSIREGETRITLTSHYQPLLRPRALWQPIEHKMAGQLHGHILTGMTWEAEPETRRNVNHLKEAK